MAVKKNQMTSIRVGKAVGRRKQRAHALCLKMNELTSQLRVFFSMADEQKKSPSGISAIYSDILHELNAARVAVGKIVAGFAEIHKHNKICRFGIGLDADDNDVVNGDDPHTPRMGQLIAEIRAIFDHIEDRLRNHSQTKGLESFMSRSVHVKTVIAELYKQSLAWREAIHAYLKSPAFRVPFGAVDSVFNLYPDEVEGSKTKKREFLSTFRNYRDVLEMRKADREFVLDEKKYDITGTRYADASENGSSDSDASVKSIDYDLASDEIDPDATVDSDTEEESFTDSQEDSAEVSQATGMFEANIEQVNRSVVAAAGRTMVTRGQYRLRSGGARVAMDRLVPLLEQNQTDENEVVRRYKKRRRANLEADDDYEEELLTDDDQSEVVAAELSAADESGAPEAPTNESAADESDAPESVANESEGAGESDAEKSEAAETSAEESAAEESGAAEASAEESAAVEASAEESVAEESGAEESVAEESGAEEESAKATAEEEATGDASEAASTAAEETAAASE